MSKSSTSGATPLAVALFLASAAASAQMPGYAPGKLLLTGGVTSVEGAAGGGLTPWAVTGGYATGQDVSVFATASRVRTRDFGLSVQAVGLAWGEHVEATFAHQEFDTGPVAGALAAVLMDPAFNGLRLKQDIIGLKVRVFGDAVLDSDTWLPQIAVGLELKETNAGHLAPVLASFGAKGKGTDFYISATKLFLAESLLVNGTLRATRANQTGLLGFGATGHDSYQVRPEISVAYLFSKSVALGAEYRAKPDNLRDNTALGAAALREGAWKDIFLAWAPSKHLSVTAAYVDLGRIVPGVVTRRQTGSYLSAQLAY